MNNMKINTLDQIVHYNILLNMTCFIVRQIKYSRKRLFINICQHFYILGKGTMGNRTLGNGTFQDVDVGIFLLSGKRDILSSGRRDTLLSGKRNILSSGKDSILWEGFYPLGRIISYGKDSILWNPDHLSSEIRDTLWDPGHGKQDTLSPGIRTTYPLGSCYLGNEVQNF